MRFEYEKIMVAYICGVSNIYRRIIIEYIDSSKAIRKITASVR